MNEYTNFGCSLCVRCRPQQNKPKMANFSIWITYIIIMCSEYMTNKSELTTNICECNCGCSPIKVSNGKYCWMFCEHYGYIKSNYRCITHVLRKRIGRIANGLLCIRKWSANQMLKRGPTGIRTSCGWLVHTIRFVFAKHPYTFAIIRRGKFFRSQDFWTAQNFGCGWHTPYSLADAIHTQYIRNTYGIHTVYIRCYSLLSADIRTFQILPW